MQIVPTANEKTRSDAYRMAIGCFSDASDCTFMVAMPRLDFGTELR